MSQAIQLIVDGYVKLSGRKALEDLKQHRERLATELRFINGMLDLSSTIKQFETEIAIIDDGVPVPIVNPIRWLLIENRAMLLLDV
jgi:hypothetical protein